MTAQRFKGWIIWTAQLWITWSLQVYDDEGLLACCALSKTHIQTAGRGPRSLPGHDIQPGQSSSHHYTRKKQKCLCFLEVKCWFNLCHLLRVAYRSIWSCQCLWTNIPPATRTPAAPPAPLERTLSSPMMLEPRSPACQSSLPTPTGQPLRNADTSSPFRQARAVPPLPASWGWTFPHIPRDEAKKKQNKTLVLWEKGAWRHLAELVGSHGLKSEAVSRFLVVAVFMGHFVLTGVAVRHSVRKNKEHNPALLSTLGIPQVMKIKRTDCDYVRGCFISSEGQYSAFQTKSREYTTKGHAALWSTASFTLL